MRCTISHGACTAAAGDIPMYPRRRTTTCTATGEHENISPARYILATTPYITTCLLTCIHLLHCRHSCRRRHAPVLTSLTQPPATTAATCQRHMHRQLHSSPCQLSIHIQQCRHYPADAVPSQYVTMPNAAFLKHTRCLMRPFSYTVDLFTYITYIFISLPSFLLPCNEGIVNFYSLIFVVTYGSYFHAMKII